MSSSPTMPDKIDERLARLETKGEHRSETLDRIQDVLEDLVHYMARNEDNKQQLGKHDDRLDRLEQRLDQQKNWLESRFWVLATVVSAALIAVELAFKLF